MERYDLNEFRRYLFTTTAPRDSQLFNDGNGLRQLGVLTEWRGIQPGMRHAAAT
jgi:hypothetical protein